ncbi:MAG: sel1 repeat family protein [Alphaproteobacteria bacterium]|nr:sel1 repeat family protein [Alphaproteobacteria bacterium]
MLCIFIRKQTLAAVMFLLSAPMYASEPDNIGTPSVFSAESNNLVTGMEPGVRACNAENDDMDDYIDLIMNSCYSIPEHKEELGIQLCSDPRYIGKEKNTKAGLRLLEKAADSGRLNAQYHLGIFLLSGKICEDNEENKQQAYKWLERAAKNGHLESQHYWGACLLNAVGCKDSLENKKQGIQFLNEASLAGHAPSQSYLGNYMLKGIHFEKTKENIEKGIELLTKAAHAGRAEDMHELGIYLLNSIENGNKEENEKNGFKWLSKSSGLGYKVSFTDLGRLLLDSIGCEDTPENKKKAFDLFKKSVDEGCVTAQRYYGKCLVKSIGCDDTPENQKKGLEILTQRANAGCLPSKHVLAECLIKAVGCKDTPENQEKGRKFMSELARDGHPASQVFVGIMLLEADGFEDTIENKQKGLAWIVKYVEQADLQTQVNFSLNYISDPEYDSFPELNERVISILINAADKGNHLAALYVAAGYMNGAYRFKKDISKSLQYFIKANHVYYLQDHIAFCYLKLLDYRNALKYYILAKEQGITVSDATLQYLESKANPQLQDRKKSKNSSKSLTIQGIKEGLDQQKSLLLQQYNAVCANLKKLEELKAKNKYTSDSGDEVSANELETYKKDFLYNHNNQKSSASDKNANITLFQNYLINIKDRIFRQNQGIEVKIRISSQIKSINETRPPFDISSIGEESRKARAEVKKNAKHLLEQEKEKAHAKHNKSNAKKKKKRAKKPVVIETKTEIKDNGPFSDTRLVEKTGAVIPPAAMENAYLILNAVRQSRDINDVLKNLKQLEIKASLTKLSSLEYAGCPEADAAYEVRINDQYRIIIPFIKVRNEVIANDNNNRNSETTDKELIYRSEIYICDPHVKQ